MWPYSSEIVHSQIASIKVPYLCCNLRSTVKFSMKVLVIVVVVYVEFFELRSSWDIKRRLSSRNNICQIGLLLCKSSVCGCGMLDFYHVWWLQRCMAIMSTVHHSWSTHFVPIWACRGLGVVFILRFPKLKWCSELHAEVETCTPKQNFARPSFVEFVATRPRWRKIDRVRCGYRMFMEVRTVTQQFGFNCRFKTRMVRNI